HRDRAEPLVSDLRFQIAVETDGTAVLIRRVLRLEAGEALRAGHDLIALARTVGVRSRIAGGDLVVLAPRFHTDCQIRRTCEAPLEAARESGVEHELAVLHATGIEGRGRIRYERSVDGIFDAVVELVIAVHEAGIRLPSRERTAHTPRSSDVFDVTGDDGQET